MGELISEANEGLMWGSKVLCFFSNNYVKDGNVLTLSHQVFEIHVQELFVFGRLLNGGLKFLDVDGLAFLQVFDHLVKLSGDFTVLQMDTRSLESADHLV